MQTTKDHFQRISNCTYPCSSPRYIARSPSHDGPNLQLACLHLYILFSLSLSRLTATGVVFFIPSFQVSRRPLDITVSLRHLLHGEDLNVRPVLPGLGHSSTPHPAPLRRIGRLFFRHQRNDKTTETFHCFVGCGRLRPSTSSTVRFFPVLFALFSLSLSLYPSHPPVSAPICASVFLIVVSPSFLGPSSRAVRRRH